MPTLAHNRFVARPSATLAPVVITTASLPSATLATAYSTTLAVIGGQGPYTWSLLSAVPNTGAWLSLSSSGVFSGTPGTLETETVLVQVTDAKGTKASQFLSLIVTGVALSISTSSPLPAATVGSAYNFTMAATGGVPPYTWSITADTPDTGGWLSISSGGILSGTPGTAETESVTIKVQDSGAANVSSVFSLPVNASGGLFLQEDYNGYPTGNVTSISAALAAKGYFSVTFTNSTDLQILGRASLPAGLLSDPNFPAGKTQVARFTLPVLEAETRLTWAGFPNTTTRDVSWSWWEYRPNNNNGGEKFHRAGSYVGGSIGGNRGIDDIMGMGLPAGTLTLFANSANMHSFPDQPFGVFNWPSGLHHFERVDHLPTDTSTTYSCSLYIDGVLQGSVSGLQIYDNSTEAAVGWQLWDFGGWASGSGTFPIQRYMCAARIASTRQGVWPMSAV